jgi:hypothetical protein
VWIAIGIIGAVSLANFFLLLICLGRTSELESFMVILSGIVIGSETNAQLIDYLRTRGDHPAGKNRRDIREPN